MPIPGSIKLFFQRKKQVRARAVVDDYINGLKKFKNDKFFRYGRREDERKLVLYNFLDFSGIKDWDNVSDVSYSDFICSFPSTYLAKRNERFINDFREFLNYKKEILEILYSPNMVYQWRRRRKARDARAQAKGRGRAV